MVARFQSIIGEETKTQLLEKEGRDYPDYAIACVGGGSNAAGLFYPFLNDERVKLVEAEAAGLGVDTEYTAATIQRGREGVLHGSRILIMQTDDGQILEAYSISAGLDYPGIGPIHAHLARTGRAQVFPITDKEAVDAAFLLTRIEGILPALESSHALACLPQMKFKPSDVVVVSLSGRGDKDMETYGKIMAEQEQQKNN
jgi:tryptophan synthase beta chain